jgi:dipeptidyl aminopeptidase/acylaminoacyl peptidase
MNRIYLSLLVAASFLFDASASAAARTERGSLLFDNIPDPTADLSDKLEAYLNARQATPLGFSPKGQLLIATRFADVDQLHLLEQPMGERRQLTFLHEAVNRAAFSPDPARSAYVYLKDAGGNENTQLYYQRLGEPAAKLLTDGKSGNGSPVWSNTGREIAFFSNSRDGASVDIDIVDPESGALPRLAVAGDGGSWSALDWSPDDRKLLVLKSVSSTEAYLYVVDLATGQKKEVEPTPGKVAIAAAKFSRDGTGVYLISDRDSEFTQLRYVNLFTAEKNIVSGHQSGDVEELALSRDGHYLAYTVNDGGTDKLNLMDLRARQDLTQPKLPAAGIVGSLSFDADSKRLALSFAASNQPRDAYVLELAANRLEPWTRSEAGAVELSKFVAPRLSQFQSFDRPDGRPRQLPVYVYEPAGPGPHPVLISLHDGPASTFRPTFDPWLTFVVNELGFAVVAPNVRGSAGYGKSFSALDKGPLRDDAVKDVGALLVWIGLQSTLDAKRVVVSGQGYGGYLALATMANFSDRLRGAVDVSGFADLIGFLTNTSADRQNQRRAEFGDERDPDTRAYLRRISPLTNADRILRPVLVVHGKIDSQVSFSEADQIVNRLRGKGGEVWFLTAGDEGHSFQKKQNRDAYLKVFAQFLVSSTR